jgi:putative tryptophan/tyrosine transport system substrate-binding protein
LTGLDEEGTHAQLTDHLRSLFDPKIAEHRGRVVRNTGEAGALGLTLHILKASSERDFDEVFATLVQLRPGALIITVDGLFNDHIDQLAALARRYSVPATFQFREFAAADGLMSYGPALGEAFRQAGILAGRILKGEKPADLPVMRSTKFELVINMKAAEALGIVVPISMQMLADEVIE